MDKRLAKLIDDYLESVSLAVGILEQSGICRPSSNIEWACNGIPQTGVLLGAVKYRKHGFGCAVHLTSGVVDFDFGHKGEINGFDTWRLFCFAEDRPDQYGFKSETELENCFKAQVAAGAIFSFGHILHYLHEACT